MRRLRFWINLLLLIVPLGLLANGAYRFVRHLFAYLNSDARLAGVLSTEATRMLGREVRVRDVKITGNLWSLTSSNRIELRDVFVAEGPTAATGAFVQAQKVIVHYNLRQLLLNTDPQVPQVDEVQIVGPQVTLRRDVKGRWNFANLITPQTTGGRRFADRLTLQNGSLRYRDASFPHPPQVPRQLFATRLNNLHGVVLLRPDQSVAFDLRGTGDPRLVQDFHVTGIAEPRPLQISARIIANHLSLPFLGSRLLPPRQARLSAGTADLDVSALYLPRPGQPSQRLDLKALTADGQVRLTDLSVLSGRLGEPLYHVNGAATFTTDSIQGSVSGRYAGLDFQADGKALGLIDQILSRQGTPHNTAAAPTLALRGTVQNADLSRLLRQPPIQSGLAYLPNNVRTILRRLKGQGQATFAFQGTPQDPNATLDAQLATLSDGRYRLSDVEAHARLVNRQAQVSLRTRYAHGDLSARGQIAMDKAHEYRIEAHGRGIALGSLGLGLGQPVAGTAQVDAIAQGKIGALPLAAAQVQLSDVKWSGQRLKTVYAKVDTVGKALVVRSLRAEDPKGIVEAQGTVALNVGDLKASRLNLTLQGDELSLPAISRAFPQVAASIKNALPTGLSGETAATSASLEGTGYVQAKIGGTLDAPLAQGQISAYAVGVGKVRVDKIAADFDLSRRSLIVSQGAIRRYPGLIRFSGLLTNPLQPDRTLSLTVGADRVGIADLLQMTGVSVGDNLILGYLSTDDLLVEGPLNALRIRRPFLVSLQRGSVNGLPITNAFARIGYDQTRGLDILQANAEVAGGTLSASGQVRRGGAVDLNVHAGNIDLDTLANVLPPGGIRDQIPDIGGVAGFDGQITGTAQNPTANLKITANNLDVNDVVLGNMTGTATYAADRAMIENLVLSPTPGVIGGTSAAAPDAQKLTADQIGFSRLVYNIKTRQIEGEAHVEALSTQRVREIITHSAFAATDTGKTLQEILDRLGGSLTATMAVGGTAEDPRVDITWHGQDLRIGTQPVQIFQGSARLTRESIISPSPAMPDLVTRLESYQAGASKPDAVIVAHRLNVQFKGKAGLESTIGADIDAYNVNLGLIQNLLPQSATVVKNLVATATNIGAPAATNTGAPTTAQSRSISLSGVAENIGIVASGTMTAPIVDLSATLRNVGIADPALSTGVITLDGINLDHARIEEGMVQIDGIRITKNDPSDPTAPPYRADVSGQVTGFTWRSPFLPPTAAYDLQASLPTQSLQMLAAFTTSTTTPKTDPVTVAKPGPLSTKGKPLTPVGQTLTGANPLRDTKGTITAKVNLRGTREKPSILGSVDIAASKLRLSNFHTGLKDVKASFGFEGQVLSVNVTAVPQVYNLRGEEVREGQSDPLSLKGSIALGLGDPGLPSPPTPGLILYDPRLVFDESPLPAIGSGSAKGTAMVNLKLSGEALRGPVLSGSVQVSDAQATLPSDFGSAGIGQAALKDPPRFNNVNLTFGKNVRLTNPLLNAQLDTKEANFVTLNGDLNTPRLQGRLAIGKGKLILPTARFEILPPAVLSLNYPVDAEGLPGQPTLGLTINLRAQTYLNLTSRSGVRRRYRVIVAANGPLTGLTADPSTGRSRFALSFTTDPDDLGESQEQLTAQLAGALIGAGSITQLQRNPGQAFAGLLTNVFTSSVLPGVFDQLASSLGFEELAVNYDPVQRLTLTVSRHLVGPLNVTYIRYLSAVSETYNLKLSLQFQERYQVSYDIDEQRTQRVLLEGVWHY